MDNLVLRVKVSVNKNTSNMARLRQIAQLGNPVLRQIAEPVRDIAAKEIVKIIDDLQATLADSNGVGIAAPQIYESYRIVIVASRPTPRYPQAPEMQATLMINPTFRVLNPETKKDWEGCISIPGIRALVPRFTQISVNYEDRRGDAKEIELSGFVARIFQHENDHLDGIVYLDRVQNNSDIISEKEYLKLF